MKHDQWIKDLVYLFQMIHRNHDPRIIEAIKTCISNIVYCSWMDEAGVLNPTIGIIEAFNKNDIHVTVTPIIFNQYKEDKEIGTIYRVIYEDGEHDDIEVVVNEDGRVI